MTVNQLVGGSSPSQGANIGSIMHTKQVIVVRKDLKMNHGKMAAQVAHASMGAILKMGNIREKHNAQGQLAVREFALGLMHLPAVDNWLFESSFTKVCLAVHSEKELLDLWGKIEVIGTPCALIKDSGRTVFSEPTYTCFAYGPGVSDELDKITGHLKLY